MVYYTLYRDKRAPGGEAKGTKKGVPVGCLIRIFIRELAEQALNAKPVLKGVGVGVEREREIEKLGLF